MTFNELYLDEGIGPRKLYHYTTYSALENILSQEKPHLRASAYEGTPKGKLQIALVRPSMSNPGNVQELSSGSKGGVRIVIDGAKITDKVRGTKIKTIAELPVMYKNELETHTGIRNTKKLNLFIKRGLKFLKDHPGETGKSEEFESFLARNGIMKDAPREKVYIRNDLNKYKDYTSSREREGEERITTNKYFIDLDPSYSKIELIKEPDMIYRKKDSKGFYRKKLAELIKKHSNLFKHNDIYKSFVEEEKEVKEGKVSLKDLIAINEGIGPRKLYHYTTYKALYNILKDKKINANKYLGTPKDTNQISTVRKSMDNKKNRGNLSRGANGGVKLVIDASKISDKVRGAKIKTIAELPIKFKNLLSDYTSVKKSKELDAFTKELIPLINKYKITEENSYKKSKNKEIEKEYNKILLKNMKDREDISKLKRYYGVVLSIVADNIDLSRKREGEERITLKGESLPLKDDYVKIELVNDDLFGLNYLQKISLAEMIRKNKKFFKNNDIFKKIIKIKEAEPQTGMYKGRY